MNFHHQLSNSVEEDQVQEQIEKPDEGENREDEKKKEDEHVDKLSHSEPEESEEELVEDNDPTRHPLD